MLVGQSYHTEILNEPPIKVCKPEEPLQLALIRRLWPFHHSFDFCRVRAEVPLFDDVARGSDCGHMELTFLAINKQPVLQKVLQDMSDLVSCLDWDLEKIKMSSR